MKIAFGSSGHSAGRIDWKTESLRIDLAAVATRLLGPAAKQERGRLLWRCPFHDDRNPSFIVDEARKRWRCYPCGINGDAFNLVMRLNGVGFREAFAYLTGGPAPSGKARPTPSPTQRPAPAPEPPARIEPEGMSPEAAVDLVSKSAARLFSPEGMEALAYLTGPERCLSPETIRAARLGWSGRIEARTRDGRPYVARGIVISWWNGPHLTMVKVRQPNGTKPKYAQVFFDRTRHVGIYPSPETIRPGLPLVVPEGEFDREALSEVLTDFASVVTLGSASARPAPSALGPMLAAPRWFIATDADEAGEKSAARWPPRARRIRPPGAFKDWTEAKGAGIDLARWWRDIFAGINPPVLYTWDELSRQRWGPAVGDPKPGIIIPSRPSPEFIHLP